MSLATFGADAHLIEADSGKIWAGAALAQQIAQAAEVIDQLPAGLLMLRMAPEIGPVCAYMAALRLGRAVALLDPALSAEALITQLDRYAPAAVWCPPDIAPPAQYRLRPWGWLRLPPAAPVHADLALLLSTSGSSGQPRWVRLSRRAVQLNAAAIIQSLHLTPGSLASTQLPLHLGYGLSVLNSHLSAGAGILLTGRPIVSAPFWAQLDQYGVNHFAAVTPLYRLLERLRWSPQDHPSLRVLTQSGSSMPADLVASLARGLQAQAGRLFLMYGQTEATARIAVLPPEQISQRPASVGRVVAGGQLAIQLANGEETQQPGVAGEVIYRSHCVMSGYADQAADLALGDCCHGQLATGDLGQLDADGYLYLQGRLSRIAKVSGLRISLDAIENIAPQLGITGPGAAVAPGDQRIVLWYAGLETADVERSWARQLAQRLQLSPHLVSVRGIDMLPLLSSGKTDYQTLLREAESC